MSRKSISITEEAYERLKSLKSDKRMSFSEVIVKYYPVKRKLTDVLSAIGDCRDLADSAEAVSCRMRKSRLHTARS